MDPYIMKDLTMQYFNDQKKQIDKEIEALITKKKQIDKTKANYLRKLRKGCEFKYKIGPMKGEYCPDTQIKGSDYCHTHMNSIKSMQRRKEKKIEKGHLSNIEYEQTKEKFEKVKEEFNKIKSE
jgi:hypothetical protein